MNQALIGKQDIIEMVLACVFGNGHLLFDDLPGLGKTTLAKALSQSIGGQFSRVQCTPDLMPSDITGFNIFDQNSRTFEFRPGPVFSDVLLADEINRATPRTQSALFEAMAERQVTIDNQTHTLPKTFFVIATQNPVESHGAYPLPEAQLDRFAMKLSIGYPETEDEVDLLGKFVGEEMQPRDYEHALELEELQQLQHYVCHIEVCESIRRYIVELGASTRNHAKVDLGLSPRGLMTWQRMAQSWAMLKDRSFVIPDDVIAVALPVLNLRIGGNSSQSTGVIQEILDSVDVPTES